MNIFFLGIPEQLSQITHLPHFTTRMITSSKEELKKSENVINEHSTINKEVNITILSYETTIKWTFKLSVKV